MKTTITFKRANETDLETLVDQRIAFLKEYQSGATPEKELDLRRAVKEYYAEAIPSRHCIYWLAESEGKSVGGAGMAIRRHAPQYVLINGLTAYVFNVYTCPEFRGQGIAKEIMRRLMEETKRLEIRRVELHATEMGRPLYEKLGFKPPKDIYLEWANG